MRAFKEKALTPDLDSNEEAYFVWYLEELKSFGYISSWKSQPITYSLSDKVLYEWEEQLKTRVRVKEQTLLQGHVYTPDFKIVWTSKAKDIFYSKTADRNNVKNCSFIAQEIDGKDVSIIDIKPTFDAHNMTRLFIINQKWVYSKYGIYVQKIIPVSSKKPKVKGLFEKTFTPVRFFLTNSGRKGRKFHYKTKQIKDFLKTKQ